MKQSLFTPFFFMAAYVASNILALTSILASIKFPKFARLFFLLLFGWAFWLNSSMAIESPWAYDDYADSAIPLYEQFILGAFQTIITPMVLTIAAFQGVIAISMLLKGMFFRIACWGGIVFCLAVAPIGTYAAFPATIFLGIALFILQKTDDKRYLWEREPGGIVRSRPARKGIESSLKAPF